MRQKVQRPLIGLLSVEFTGGVCDMTLNLNQDFASHPKTEELIGKIGQAGAWCFTVLWSEVSKFFPDDGVMRGWSKARIAQRATWEGKPEDFVDALVAVGYLNTEDGCYKIHDWEEHQGHIAFYRDRAKKANKARWDRAASSSTKAAQSNTTRTTTSDATRITTSGPPALHCIAKQAVHAPQRPPIEDPPDEVVEVVNAFPVVFPAGMLRVGPTDRNRVQELIDRSGSVGQAKAALLDALDKGKGAPLRYAIGRLAGIAADKALKEDRDNSNPATAPMRPPGSYVNKL